MSEIEELLRNGADANTKDENGFTLLMSFARSNDIESMKLLLDYAAEINTKDMLNYTALDYAIKDHHFSAVKFLVENGAAVSEDTYMLALKTNDRKIVEFFDSLDPEKYVFIRNVRRNRNEYYKTF